MRDDWESTEGMGEFRHRARVGGRRILILTMASLAILNVAACCLRLLCHFP